VLDIKDIMQILAILLSPLIALQVSEALQKRREKRLRKLSVFRSLMTTRASTLSQAQVEALNMVDVEFAGKAQEDKAVVEAWKKLLDHLNDRSLPPAVWGSKRDELLIQLLEKMAINLGYELSPSDIKRTSYFPQGYIDLETDQLMIRQGFSAIFQGKRTFPISIFSHQAEDVAAATAPTGKTTKEK
jgi:hypothetical protein